MTFSWIFGKCNSLVTRFGWVFFATCFEGQQLSTNILVSGKKWNWETEQEGRDNQHYFHFYVKVFLFTRFNKISLKVYVALEYLIDFVNSILISTVSYNKVLVIKVFVIYFVQYSVCCINSCNARFHFRSSFPFNLSKKICFPFHFTMSVKVSMCHKLAIKLLLRIL